MKRAETDTELDRSAARGLDRFYRDNFAKVSRFLLRKFGPGPPDPEDLAQIAFAKYVAHAESHVIPNPEAFLLLTARNVAIDERRRLGTAARTASGYAVAQENRADPSAEDVVIAQEELRRLAALVDILKPKERAALLYHRIDGLSFVEIAKRLGVSESGARKLVNQALAACAKGMRT